MFCGRKFTTPRNADDIDDLKTRQIDELTQFEESTVDAAISQSRPHLSARVRVSGHTSSANCDIWNRIVSYKIILLLNKQHLIVLCAN